MKLKTIVWPGLILPGLILSCSLSAASIYQWQDGDGVTHFSDEPPAESARGSAVRNIEIQEDYPQIVDPEDDYYSISRQWERVNEDRQARMKLQLERQKVRASQAANRQAPVNYPEQRRVYYPVYSPGLNGLLSARRFGYGLHSNPSRHFNRHGGSPRMHNTSQPAFRGYVGNVSR